VNKVLFPHGWSADGARKTAFIRLLGYDVTTPRLSDWFFRQAVAQAQAAYDKIEPDVIEGASRGGAVAMHMDSGETPLVLLAPAWKRWGMTRSLKKNCVVIYSPMDEFVPFEEQHGGIVLPWTSRSDLRDTWQWIGFRRYTPLFD
jgi:hypothetical protein